MPKLACSLARSLLSLCAPLAPLCAPSSAQPNAVRVLYSREMPRAVRAKMPSGWKSRFFGACKLPSLKQEVLIHLSSRIEEDGLQSTPDVCHCVLDVFERRKRGRRVIVKPLNTVRFDASTVDFNGVGAAVMWAEPKKQSVPILYLNLTNSRADIGQSGSYVLVNFPTGLGAQTNVQQFSLESATSWDLSAEFDGIDERGFAVVTQRLISNVSTSETPWLWNGEKFVASETKRVP